MKKTKDNLMLLNAVFITSLLIANVVAGKIVLLFGVFVVPAAVVCYAITFLMTDVIGEIWGREEAQKAVKRGFITQILASLLILMARYLPVAPFAVETQNAYLILLGQNWRFVIASMTAYLISQTNDVLIFHKLKEKYKGRHKWIRNNLSTMSSQLIDTAIFITIAFAGQVPNLWIMIVSQYFIKLCLAGLDTPLFYWFTHGEK